MAQWFTRAANYGLEAAIVALAVLESPRNADMDRSEALANAASTVLTTAVVTFRVELTLLDHYGRETRLTVCALPAVLGRDERADVQLTDPWVSHIHCEIEQIGDALVIRDLDSKNGVFLHGHRIRESQILSGDRLTVGRTHVTVNFGGKPQTIVQVGADKAGSEVSGRNDVSARAPETLELLHDAANGPQVKQDCQPPK